MAAVHERARRTPGGMLGVEEAVELLAVDRPEEVAEFGGIVGPRSGARFEERRECLGPEARAELVRLGAATERLEPGAMAGREQLVVPLELHQRPTPVEESPLHHPASASRVPPKLSSVPPALAPPP